MIRRVRRCDFVGEPFHERDGLVVLLVRSVLDEITGDDDQMRCSAVASESSQLREVVVAHGAASCGVVENLTESSRCFVVETFRRLRTEMQIADVMDAKGRREVIAKNGVGDHETVVGAGDHSAFAKEIVFGQMLARGRTRTFRRFFPGDVTKPPTLFGAHAEMEKRVEISMGGSQASSTISPKNVPKSSADSVL